MSQKLKKNQISEVSTGAVQLLDGLVKFQIFYCQLRDVNSLPNPESAPEDRPGLKLLAPLEETSNPQKDPNLLLAAASTPSVLADEKLNQASAEQVEKKSETVKLPVLAVPAEAANKSEELKASKPEKLSGPALQVEPRPVPEKAVAKDETQTKMAVVSELLSTLSELKSEQEITKSHVSEIEELTNLELTSLNAAVLESFLDDNFGQDQSLKKPAYLNRDQYPDILKKEEATLKRWDEPAGSRKKKKSFSFLTSIFRRAEPRDATTPTNRLGKKTRSTVPKPGVDYFFRVVNDELLFNLGNSYYQDFKKGQKHFAFAHVNASESQKRSILGVASFIKYFEGSKILIVTGQMGKTYYEAFKGEPLVQTTKATGHDEISYKVYVVNNLHYVEINELSKHINLKDPRTFSVTVKAILDDYDLVLFDLPPTSARKEQYDVYLPLLHTMESVTLTVSLGKNRFSEIDELMRYFNSYNIKIKGSIVDRNAGRSDHRGEL